MQVVAQGKFGAGPRMDVRQGRQRDHVVVAVKHVELAELAGLCAIIALGLHIYLPLAVEPVEIVYKITAHEGLQRVAETGVDGVMIGRGAFGNPWIFRDNLDVAQARGLPLNNMPQNKKQAGGLRYITPLEKLSVMLEHARLFNELLGAHKSFYIMRKHFKAYCSGFDGAHELRAKLMEAKNLPETEEIVGEYLSTASF